MSDADWRRPVPFDRFDGLAALGLLLFLVGVGSQLGGLMYNFDEGVNIHHARRIVAGQAPYVDFLYHQPPLYPLTLALVALPAPDALLPYRLPSLLAAALTAWLTFRIARRGMAPGAALAAGLLVAVAPVQYFGLVALPNGLMTTLSTAALLLIFFRPGLAPTAAGGALLSLAILYKPLALASALAAALALAAARDLRRLAVLAGAGLATGALAWVVLHVWSDGVFTQLLGLQASRYAGKSGFQVMAGFAPFADLLEHLEIRSAVAWNLYEHRRTFLALHPHASTHLALLALGGQLVLLSRAGRAFAGRRALITLWWLLPLLFALFVWEPSWDHYFVQYLPAFGLLAGLFLGWLAGRRRRRAARAAVALALAVAILAGVFHLLAQRRDYGRLPRPAVAGEAWLTFDPFLNFVSRTRPACGVVDPFNVYGERSLTALSDAPVWGRFHVSREELLACLAADPGIRILRGYWSTWFVDPELEAFLEDLPAERFVELPPDLGF